MKAKWILATLFVMFTASLAIAGGPPPMYVVVTKVELDTGRKGPDTIKIWGHFTRVEPKPGEKGIDYNNWSKPTFGYVYFSIKDRNDAKVMEEIKEWQKAAGSRKAVAVGSCGDAGCMLKCPIHSEKETVAKPDAEYTSEILKRFGTLYASDDFAKHPAVAALVKQANSQKQ